MFLVALDGFDHLDELLEQKPDGVIVGVYGLSSRSRAMLEASQLKEAVRFFGARGVSTYVNAQALIEQSRLDQVSSLLEQVFDAGLAGIYIADDGMIALSDAIAEKRKTGSLRSFLIMQPETLLCSGEDACFYLEQGLQGASLSHELSLKEIVQAARTAESKKLSGLEILAAGHFSWMESRRPLIENYLRFCGRTQDFESGKLYTIQEQMRDFRLPIWQDELGTHVLSDRPAFVGADLGAIKEAGIRRVRIDALLKGNLWAAGILKQMKQILEGNPEGTGLSSTLFEQESLIFKPKKEDGYAC